jgi:hypothetical protein
MRRDRRAPSSPSKACQTAKCPRMVQAAAVLRSQGSEPRRESLQGGHFPAFPVTRQGEFFTRSQFGVIVLRHSSAGFLLTDPSKRCSCKRELDGTDCFTFDKFGVGIKAEGF